MLSLKVYTKSIATVYIITYSTFDVVIVDNVMITDFSRKLLQFNAVGELCASSKISSVRWFLYYRPRHQTLGPIPLPSVRTSGGHHWRPVHTCSFEDLPPTHWYWYLVVATDRNTYSCWKESLTTITFQRLPQYFTTIVTKATNITTCWIWRP